MMTQHRQQQSVRMSVSQISSSMPVIEFEQKPNTLLITLETEPPSLNCVSDSSASDWIRLDRMCGLASNMIPLSHSNMSTRFSAEFFLWKFNYKRLPLLTHSTIAMFELRTWHWLKHKTVAVYVYFRIFRFRRHSTWLDVFALFRCGIFAGTKNFQIHPRAERCTAIGNAIET